MKVTRNIIFVILTLICGILLCGTAYSQTTKNKVSKIVIDPGHGGKAPGTVYKNILEKDITLKVALMLGDLIKQNMPDVKVIYTRQTDINVELAERGNIANKAGADLFLSIHVDGIKSTSATGSGSYVMGMDKNQANLEVAMRENDVISYEDDYSVKYEGYIPGSAESFIIFSLMQYVNTDQSMQMASLIQKHYKANTPIPDRGARQAPYLVLWKTAMPSVLTEIGFLSNAHDRAFLTTSDGQKKIARSLFNAFSEYKSKVEGKSNPMLINNDAAVADHNFIPSENNNTSASLASNDISARSNSGEGVFFSVQVCSSTSKLSSTHSRFGSYKGKVIERKIGNMYKYYVGEFADYQEAVSMQGKVRREIKDAFVVAFKDQQPIGVNEARALIQ